MYVHEHRECEWCGHGDQPNNPLVAKHPFGVTELMHEHCRDQADWETERLIKEWNEDVNQYWRDYEARDTE